MAFFILPDKVINIALSQVGYKETPLGSNKTKYARDLDAVNFYNYPKYTGGVSWCDIFVDWCIFEAANRDKDRALAALYEPKKDNCGAGCKYSANYYRKNKAWSNKAVLGSQIFFGKQGAETHTGLVVAIGATTITTVEGNKNNRVMKCSYKKTDSRIVGYGLIKYDNAPTPTPEPTPTPTPEGESYTVKTKSGDSLRLREKPTTKSKQTGAIPNNKTVKASEVVKGQVVGGVDTWIKTTYGGAQGYASGKYLSPTPVISEPTPTPEPEEYKLYKVKTKTGVDLRIREKPTTKSKQIGSIPNNKTCKVFEIANNWARVEYNNIQGYSSARYLKEV